MSKTSKHIDQIEKEQAIAVNQAKLHRVSSSLDFNEVLDQYYLLDSSSLVAIFSNQKISGRPQTVDVTRRIKTSTIKKWDFKIAENAMDLFVNFGIKEFYHIINLIKTGGTTEFDCYKIEKQIQGVTLPLNTYIYLVEQELSLSARFANSFGSSHVNSALLVFKRTGDFEKEINMVSNISNGKVYSEETVDRQAITSYESDDSSKSKKKAVSPSPATPQKPAIAVSSKEEEEKNKIVMALLKGEKKISYLSPQDQHLVISYLERKKSMGAITSSENKLLKMTVAYRSMKK